ncbi:hypothetical protein OMK64_05375 [Cellulomonas fimi]|uniref:AMIN-like domain-containing (lipo)protein n=1 Tax=Cellulomonas fimi TaxID=1708 RepID=UPI00234D47FF|nr:hypothetical protein [Cellulomonas fimi]MDC7120960.1 hypothetical protein [Cellulomonas fimi]
MRKWIVSVLTLVLVAGLHLLSAPAASAAPYCGQVWGSLAKSASGPSAEHVVGVRAGRHTCYDRLVLDLDSPLGGWSVRYVDVVRQDGSGEPVTVRGGARLEVVAWAGVVPTDSWFVGSGGRLVDTSGYRTFRDVVWAGSFESVTTVGLGVRARLPFRAFVLAGPGSGSRLVVDVGHQWCATGTSC